MYPTMKASDSVETENVHGIGSEPNIVNRKFTVVPGRIIELKDWPLFADIVIVVPKTLRFLTSKCMA